MPLVKNFNLTFPYHFRKEEPLPLVAICGTIICGTIICGETFLEKSMKTTTVYTFVPTLNHFCQRRKIKRLRPIVDLKFRYQSDASVTFILLTLPTSGLKKKTFPFT